MQHVTPALDAWREEGQPLLYELFAMAHAITGQRDAARVALTDGLLDAYVQQGAWRGRMSFRDALLRATLHTALDQTRRISGDSDWDGLIQDVSRVDRLSPAVYAEAVLSRMDVDTRRALCMKYAFNMQISDIARALNSRESAIKNALDQAVAAISAALSVRKKATEAWLTTVAADAVSDNNALDAAYIWATFEREAMNYDAIGRGAVRSRIKNITPGNIAGGLLKAALIATVLAALYVVAILVDKPA